MVVPGCATRSVALAQPATPGGGAVGDCTVRVATAAWALLEVCCADVLCCAWRWCACCVQVRLHGPVLGARGQWGAPPTCVHKPTCACSFLPHPLLVQPESIVGCWQPTEWCQNRPLCSSVGRVLRAVPCRAMLSLRVAVLCVVRTARLCTTSTRTRASSSWASVSGTGGRQGGEAGRRSREGKRG